MKKWKMMITALIVSGFTIVNVAAQPHERGQRPSGGQHGPERMMEKLDLTDAQRAQVEQIHLDMVKESLDTQNKLGEKEAQLRTQMSGGVDNQSAIYDLIEEIGLLETELRKQRVTARLEVREVLDDDQKVKFDQMAMRLQKHARRGGGFGPRHGE